MPKAKTNDQFLKELQTAQKGKIIALEKYTNKRTQIKVKCTDCGNEFKTLPGHLIKENPTGCPKCSSQRVSDEDFKKKLNEIHKGTIITSDSYINSSTTMNFHCNTCGENFKTTPQHITSPSKPTGCPKCSKAKTSEKQKLSKEEILARVKLDTNDEYEIIDWLDYEKVSDKVLFRHKLDNNEFEMTVNNFLHGGQRCPLHKMDGVKDYLFTPYSNEYYIKRIKTECHDYLEYEFQEEFKNSYDKVKVLHKTCGYLYEVSASKFLDNRRCPNCANNKNSKAIKEIKNYLTEHNYEFEIEKQYPDLLNPEGTCQLRIDIFIESLNLAIEYDGEFHDTEFNINNKEQIARRKILDDTKNTYCIEHGIKLLRIHHSRQHEIKQILDKYLNSTTIESFFNENLLVIEKRVE